MNDDLIRRQAVLDALHNSFTDGFNSDKWWNSTHVLWAINNAPSVNPQEPKTGHWIEENHDEYEIWICSECGAHTELDMSEEYGCGWKFCPNCGARMESEDIGDYPDEIPNQFDNLTGSMNV